jgi:hypothetical protein
MRSVAIRIMSVYFETKTGREEYFFESILAIT